MTSFEKPEIVRRTVFLDEVILEPLKGQLLIAPYGRKDKPFIEDIFEENGTRYKGPIDQAILREKLKLPRIAEEPNGRRLLDEIKEHIHRYVDFSNRDLDASAAYIILSYCYTDFNVIPYLRFRGDLGTGKSRGMDVVGGLCYKSIQVDGGMSAPSLFRLSNLYGGTMVIDEADFAKSDESAEIIKALNAGFKEGGCVTRCDPKNVNDIEFFDVFGPKVLASRKGWSDPALESRCFPIQMRETTRQDVRLHLTSSFRIAEEQIREYMTWWRADHLRNRLLEPDENKFREELQQVDHRTAQIAFPLLHVERMFECNSVLNHLQEFATEAFESRRSSPEGMVAIAMIELATSGELPFGAKAIQQWLMKELGISERDFSPQRIGRLAQGMGIVKDRKFSGRFYDIETPLGLQSFKVAVQRYATLDELDAALDTINQTRLDV